MASLPPPPVSGDGLPGPPLRPAPAPVVLVVGYPAAPAVEAVARLLEEGSRDIACVVEADAWAEAERRSGTARAAGRLRLYRGSASEPGLGLPHTAWRLLDTAVEMYCVASPEALASGHAREFADECPHLERLHLIPTGAPRRRRLRPFSLALSAARLPFRLLSRALGVGSAVVALAGAAAAGVAAWVEVVDFDLDAALSWEELERDLWPGLPRAT